MINTQSDNQILEHQSEFYSSYLKIKDNPRYKKIWKYIFKNYPDNKAKLLDIGCTNGDFSEKLVRLGFDCYGLEFMDEAIKESRLKGIEVIKASFLKKFPFRDKTFNVVFAGEVVEHTINDNKFLEELFRVLKPGGLLILTTPNLTSLGNRLLMLFGKLPRFAYSEFHYRIYNPTLIKSKIEHAGFQIKKFDSNYILISTFFNKFIGMIGEFIGSILPFFGENFIIYAQKNKK